MALRQPGLGVELGLSEGEVGQGREKGESQKLRSGDAPSGSDSTPVYGQGWSPPQDRMAAACGGGRGEEEAPDICGVGTVYTRRQEGALGSLGQAQSLS